MGNKFCIRWSLWRVVGCICVFLFNYLNNFSSFLLLFLYLLSYISWLLLDFQIIRKSHLIIGKFKRLIGYCFSWWLSLFIIVIQFFKSQWYLCQHYSSKWKIVLNLRRKELEKQFYYFVDYCNKLFIIWIVFEMSNYV